MTVALELFSRHGVDGTSVRDIMRAAGVKNIGAVRYYFGSKEALVREVMLQGAWTFESWRIDQLSALLENGAPTLREIIRIMIGPGPEHGIDVHYVRLLATMALHKPEITPQHLDPSVTRKGFDACCKQVKALIPEVPDRVLDQRCEYMKNCIFYTLALRTTTRTESKRKRPWLSNKERERFIDSLHGMLTAPTSG